MPRFFDAPITAIERGSKKSLSAFRAAIDSLRGVFQVVALSGIVLSATLLTFLYKEVSVVRRQNNELIVYLNDFNTNVVSKIESARTNLPAYAKTNPTIDPIIKKYFATNAPDKTPPPPPPSNP